MRREAVSVESVLGAMKERGARAKLVVLDASRRNPYERRFRVFSHGLVPIDVPDNALILTSAAPGKINDDSKGRCSVLVAELLNNLNVPAADAEAVFNKTRTAVLRASNGGTKSVSVVIFAGLLGTRKAECKVEVCRSFAC